MAQPPLKILFEDNHLLVVDKPPLLATMGVAPDEPSLLKIAKDYLRQEHNKPGNVYLGVVSRLDAFVSGVIIFARTSKSASRLSAQLRAGTIKKTYWAIIPNIKPRRGTLEHYLYKNEAKRRMVATENEMPGSKFARLRYQIVGTSKDECLLEIYLETGRKHQIRAQFSHIGCPILGDRKYGSNSAFAKGIALHCRSLHFEHPTRKSPITVESEPPRWWNLNRFGIS